MKYQRLKTIADHANVLRYYELGDDTAYTNAFYEIRSNKAYKISGTPSGDLIGFSHGGNAFAEGLIFLDIGTEIVYMGILEEGDEGRPNIGEIINGYQKVIDTHYDGDDGVDGKNDEGFGVEVLNNPYYLFTIVQPTGTEGTAVDDSEAGVETPHQKKNSVTPTPTPTEYTVTIKNVDSRTCTLTATPLDSMETETATLATNDTYTLLLQIPNGETIGDVYEVGEVEFEGGETATFLDHIITGDSIVEVEGEEISVFFESNGGTPVEHVTVPYGGTISAPDPAPVKTGYAFDSWCSDEELTTSFDFEAPITTTTTLYAKWVQPDPQATYQIFFDNEGDLGLTVTATKVDSSVETLEIETGFFQPLEAEFSAGDLISTAYTDITVTNGSDTWTVDTTTAVNSNIVYTYPQ